MQAQLKTARLVTTFREADTYPKFLIDCKADPKEKEIFKNAPPHDKKTNESKQNKTYKPRQTDKQWW